MDRVFVEFEVLDELDDAALVVELVALLVALVLERDLDALIQKRELAQSLREHVEAEVVNLEDQRCRA